MWRETAEKKIGKLWEMEELPLAVKVGIINMYGDFINRLKAEILKLRTYPIPEHWCSNLMREKLTHKIKGEFVFFVCPELDEDIIPLIVCVRDLLPGGLTRKEYKKRLSRVEKEFELEEYRKKEAWERENMATIGKIIKWFSDITEEIERRIEYAFAELPLLHRDGRTLEYLVNKNEDDKLLRELWDALLRSIRHFYYNRIDIPSVAISYENRSLICVTPPKDERNLPVASGVDRGAIDGYQLVTPGSVLVEDKTVIVADRCGHLVSWYRHEDLEFIGCFHLESAETPVSMTLLFDALYVCYSGELVQYNLIRNSTGHIQTMNLYFSIEIPGISCVTSTASNLYVGTIKPSVILMGLPLLHIDKENALNPIQYPNKNKFPWLQDMKPIVDRLLCLFTGTPYPLQLFTTTGFQLLCIIASEGLSGSYHFDLYFNSVNNEWHIYVADFWENVIKVFDLKGNLVDTYCEKGSDLCQLIHPTGIFVEPSGYINICDMKEDNCVQRL